MEMMLLIADPFIHLQSYARSGGHQEPSTRILHTALRLPLASNGKGKRTKQYIPKWWPQNYRLYNELFTKC